MLTLQISTRHLGFAISNIFAELNPRFQVQVSDKIKANEDQAFVQTIDINIDTLMQCWRGTSSKSFGVAEDIAPEMRDALKPQIIALSNIADMQAAAQTNATNKAQYDADLQTYQQALDAYNQNPQGDAPVAPAEPTPVVVEPNEATQALIRIQEFTASNNEVTEAQIINGLTQAKTL